MEWSILFGFTLFAVSNTVAPGPNFILISKTVPTASRSVSLATIAGLLMASWAHGLFAIFGLSIILTSNLSLFFIVKLLGAAYLCFLGLYELICAVCSKSGINSSGKIDSSQTKRKGFRDGALTNFLNPYTYIFYLAVFPQFITDNLGGTAFAMLLLLIFIIVQFTWFTFVVLTFERIVAVFRSIIFARMVQAVSGICLVIIGFSIAAFS